MNAKILAAGAALVLSLAACSDEPETPPTTTEPTTEQPTTEEPTTEDPTTEEPTTEEPAAADGELSEGLAEYLRIEAHAMDTLKENPESGSLFNELFSDFWSTGEQTDEVSRVVTEYVVKDAARSASSNLSRLSRPSPSARRE